MQSLSAAGTKLIQEFEGCRLTAYVCPAGVLTIGYGHTGPDVDSGESIPQSKADELLAKDVARFVRAVNELIAVPLNQNQFDALVSFAFNCGEGALQDSTLRRRLNAGEDPNTVASQELPRWNNGGMPGLVRRRWAEVDLFCGAVQPTSASSFTCKVPTFLKKHPIPSDDLSAIAKVAVKAGETYKNCKVIREEGGHKLIEIGNKAGQWYIYPGHWAF